MGSLPASRTRKHSWEIFWTPSQTNFFLSPLSSFFSLYGLVPTWLTITIISRDIIVITGWVILYLLTHTAKVEPTMMGKLAITFQLILICYILLDINLPAVPDIHGYLIWLTAVFTNNLRIALYLQGA